MFYTSFLSILVSSLSIIASALVVLTKNPMNATLSLILCFCCVVSLLLSLEIDYIAFIFLIIYVGAITVILLFVSMLVNIRISFIKENSREVLLLCFMLSTNFLFLAFMLIQSNLFSGQLQQNWLFLGDFVFKDFFFNVSSLNIVAFVLYSSSEYLVVCSMLLLLALIGSIFLTLHKNFSGKKQNIVKQSMTSLFFWQFS